MLQWIQFLYHKALQEQTLLPRNLIVQEHQLILVNLELAQVLVLSHNHTALKVVQAGQVLILRVIVNHQPDRITIARTIMQPNLQVQVEVLVQTLILTILNQVVLVQEVHLVQVPIKNPQVLVVQDLLPVITEVVPVVQKVLALVHRQKEDKPNQIINVNKLLES